jgi:hypothetical protein
VLEHCHDGETTFDSPLFGAFPSDCTPTATKEVNVYFFIDNFTFTNELIPANSCKLHNRIPGIIQTTTVTPWCKVFIEKLRVARDLRFLNGGDEDSVLVGCYAVSAGEWFPTFRKIVVPSSLGSSSPS